MQNLRQLFFTWYQYYTDLESYYATGKAALLSVLFNYTPLVIGGTDENKQLTIMKPTQTDINRNK